MQDSHTRLSVWFWAAYLVATQTPGQSAVQFQRQLGIKRYETAFQILHKLRAGMVRPDRDRIGGDPENHVEVDEALGRRQDSRRGPWRSRPNASSSAQSKFVWSKPKEGRAVPRRQGTICGSYPVGGCAGSVGQVARWICRGGSRAGHSDRDGRMAQLYWTCRKGLSPSANPDAGQPGDGGGLPADYPSRVWQFENVDQGNPSRRQPAIPLAGLSQRIHFPLQSEVHPVQRLPVIARYQWTGCRADLRSAILWRVGTPPLQRQAY